MASSTPSSTQQVAPSKAAQAAKGLHPNPRIARALADNASAPGKYDSAAALCRAHNITDKATQRQLRQVLRDAGQGVGRGRRYAGITTPKVRKAAQANAQRKAKAAKAAPAAPKGGAAS